MIRILIADDQTLMRDGLRTILENEEDMEVVSLVSDGLQAYEQAKIFKPDVILLDIRMPVMDGVESVRLIKRDIPVTKVIMLTTFDDEEYITEAISHGASGYLLKSIAAERLLNSIRGCVAGICPLQSDVFLKLARSISKSSDSQLPAYATLDTTVFSDREIEISRMMIKGFTNREIANGLHLSDGTVKNYISVIYEKLGTNDRVKAVNALKALLNNSKL